MNERIRSYTYLYPEPGKECAEFWVDPDAAAEAAARFVNLGFTAVKFDPAGPYTIRGGHEPAMSDITRSVAFCKAIREAVGDRADLLFGTHGQFTTPGAIRMGRELEPYNPLWYEEPIPPDNLLEFAEVATQVRIPLATGERLTTKAEFGTLLRAGGVKILQPALGRVGGIWEAKKIAAMAEIFNAEMAPHLYAGPVEWAANVHFAASIPNLLIAETIETGGAFHLALIRNTIKWEDGYILPPEGPGLGIEFDEDLARAHPFTGTGLHLQMQEAPCDYRHGNRFEGGTSGQGMTQAVFLVSSGMTDCEAPWCARRGEGDPGEATAGCAMRINQHIPFNARRELATPFGQTPYPVDRPPAAYRRRGPDRLGPPDAHAGPWPRGSGNQLSHPLWSPGEPEPQAELPAGFLYADRSGFSGWSEVALRPFDPATVDGAQAEHFLTRQIEKRILARGLSKEPQTRSGAALRLPKGYTLFTLQEPRDVVLKLADVSDRGDCFPCSSPAPRRSLWSSSFTLQRAIQASSPASMR